MKLSYNGIPIQIRNGAHAQESIYGVVTHLFRLYFARDSFSPSITYHEENGVRSCRVHIGIYMDVYIDMYTRVHVRANVCTEIVRTKVASGKRAIFPAGEEAAHVRIP